MFVRPTQLTLLDDDGNALPADVPSAEERQPPRSRLSRYLLESLCLLLFTFHSI